MDEMPSYHTVDRCAACGMARKSISVSVEFVRNGVTELYGEVDESYMLITCRHCGYSWKELPLYMKPFE